MRHGGTAGSSEQIANVVRLPGSGNVEVAVSTREFNMEYQLSHLYRHFFDDGLWLRMVMDYYFVLTARNNDNDRLLYDIFLLLSVKTFLRYQYYLFYRTAAIIDLKGAYF